MKIFKTNPKLKLMNLYLDSSQASSLSSYLSFLNKNRLFIVHNNYIVMESKIFSISKFKSGFINNIYMMPLIPMFIPFRKEIMFQLQSAIDINDKTLIFICMVLWVFLVFCLHVVKALHDRAEDNSKIFSIKQVLINTLFSFCIALIVALLVWYYLELSWAAPAIVAAALFDWVTSANGPDGLQQMASHTGYTVKPSDNILPLPPHVLAMDGNTGNTNTNAGPQSQSSTGSTYNNNTGSATPSLDVRYSFNNRPKTIKILNNAVLFKTNNAEETALNNLSNSRNTYDILVARFLTDFINDLIEKNKIPHDATIRFQQLRRIHQPIDDDLMKAMLGAHPEGSKDWRISRLNAQSLRSQELTRMKWDLITETERVLKTYYPSYINDPACTIQRNSIDRYSKTGHNCALRCNSMKDEILRRISSNNN